MKITVEDITIENKWDYQYAYLLLNMQGIGGKTLTPEQHDSLEKQVTKFMWTKISLQYLRIHKYCTSKTGMFNEQDERHHNTPIIAIHGSFYMQLVIENNKDTWMWESIDLQPYRFYFNKEHYFERLLTNAIARAVIKNGEEILPRFNKLLKGLKIELPYYLKKLTPEEVIK